MVGNPHQWRCWLPDPMVARGGSQGVSCLSNQRSPIELKSICPPSLETSASVMGKSKGRKKKTRTDGSPPGVPREDRRDAGHEQASPDGEPPTLQPGDDSSYPDSRQSPAWAWARACRWPRPGRCRVFGHEREDPGKPMDPSPSLPLVCARGLHLPLYTARLSSHSSISSKSSS